MSSRSFGCIYNQGCTQEIKSRVEKAIPKPKTHLGPHSKNKAHKQELQSKVMGSLLTMRLVHDFFEHKPHLVPKIEPITSHRIKEGVSVAMKGDAGNIKVNSVLKITGASFSSVYFCLVLAIATVFSLASVYLPCTSLHFANSDRR